MTKATCDGYEFNFTDALNAFTFDDDNKVSQNFHGLPMKRVDILVEYPDKYLFIEVKELNPSRYSAATGGGSNRKHTNYTELVCELKYKYRDSFLFRYAEQLVSKEIHYICLTRFDEALNNSLAMDLQSQIPVGKPSQRWQIPLVKSCMAISFNTWASQFPKWTITKI